MQHALTSREWDLSVVDRGYSTILHSDICIVDEQGVEISDCCVGSCRK